MNKIIKFINGTFRTLFGSTLIIALLFAMSCDNDGDDPQPELYDLSGVYTFKEAILQTTLIIPGIPIPIPAGTDITDEMTSGLLAEAPCDDPANGAVELKVDHKLFFTCIGEGNESQAGTWSINSDTTQLDLNLSVSSGNLQLKLEELEIDELNDEIGGSILNFPINKTLLAGFLASLPEVQRDAILAGIDDNFVVLVNVDIEFKKES